MSLEKQNLNNQLVVACRQGEFARAKELLENGADFKTLDHAPLMAAAGHGYVEILELLEKFGEDLKWNDNAALQRAQNTTQGEKAVIFLSQLDKDNHSENEALNYNPLDELKHLDEVEMSPLSQKYKSFL